MIHLLLALSLVCCSWFPQLPEQDPKIVQADKLFAGRDDIHNLGQAIALLEDLAVRQPKNYEVLWRLCKYTYYLSDREKDSTKKQKLLESGIEAGKRALEIDSSRPEAHFWLGANYGGALESGSFGLATLGDVRKEMETVLKIDEGYQNGSAYMVLGLVDLKAPRIVGGDPQKAVAEMEKGLQFGQTNAFLRLHLGEAYQAVGRNGDAREQLNAILSMKPDPDYLPELKEAQTQAQQLLTKIS